MKNIPIAKSFFDGNEEKLVSGVIRSGWIAQGRMVEDFEKKVARYTGAKYAVATSSGTTALHLALLVSGVGPGDEVIIPSFSFIATANAVVYSGAKPVFIDIDLATYNIDADEIEKFMKRSSGKVKAIMPVHQFGLPCDIDSISNIAKRYGLFLIEDAACALGSSYKGVRVGKKSDIACFSFHPRKIMTTGEGGMLLTNNKSSAEKAIALRNHGLCAPAEDYKILGYNYRLTDLQAAVGIAQMSRLPAVLKARRRQARRYDEAFKKYDHIHTPFIPSYTVPNYQSYVIKIDKMSARTRDGIIAALAKERICARRGNTAIHMQSLYRKGGPRLPNTEEAAAGTIALPIYYKMTEKEQDIVICSLLSMVKL